MQLMSPIELRASLGSGLLSFPVTPSTSSMQLDEAGCRDHLQWLGEQGAAGVFPAGGTGEFFSLTLDEVARVVSAAVEESFDSVPVVAPAGYGTAIAVEMARSAEQAGADGVFLLPPYLVEPSAEGLLRHTVAVCDATSLGVVVYHRANAVFTVAMMERLADRCQNLVGFKDGIGDLDLLVRLQATLGERLVYIGGLPTAETFALPYLEMGATTYSSGIFNFAPQWARGFYDAVRRRDTEAVSAELKRFVLPYVEIRTRHQDYGVAIVKAGMRSVGRDAGPTRPPLTDLVATDQQDLAALLEGIR